MSPVTQQTADVNRVVGKVLSITTLSFFKHLPERESSV